MCHCNHLHHSCCCIVLSVCAVTIVSASLILILFLSELNYYLTTDVSSGCWRLCKCMHVYIVYHIRTYVHILICIMMYTAVLALCIGQGALYVIIHLLRKYRQRNLAHRMSLHLCCVFIRQCLCVSQCSVCYVLWTCISVSGVVGSLHLSIV